MNWIDKLERRCGGRGIPYLINGLMLGQHVTIEPDHGQATVKDGIWLNSGWIVQEDDGSAYVWAAKEGGAKLEKRSVELGEYDSDLD